MVFGQIPQNLPSWRHLLRISRLSYALSARIASSSLLQADPQVPANHARWLGCIQIPSQTQTLGQRRYDPCNYRALFGKRSIVFFARGSCRFDQTGVNNLSCFELKTLFSELTLEFVKTFPVEVHRFEVGTETGDGRVVISLAIS